jgi:Arc/MetJ-type ribon-helix-helix transcriptional regulator
MPVSVRLDAKTESLIGRLARKRRQTKSEVIRDAIGVLANQEDKGAKKKRPYDLVAHLIGCVKGGPRNLSVDASKKFQDMLIERARKRR